MDLTTRASLRCARSIASCAEAWDGARGLAHVIAYADPNAGKRFVAGMLDDYAYTVLACLDAYEVTGDFSYFRFAREIADEMIARFADAKSGGFFDTEASAGRKVEAGRPLSAAQAVSGCAHTSRQSLCRHRALTSARLHQRGCVP